MIDLATNCTTCVCGSQQWKIWASFDEDTHEISTYSLDMFCVECNARAVTPLPIDEEVQ